jgi:DNA-binding NarL/FixJ family response regulator
MDRADGEERPDPARTRRVMVVDDHLSYADLLALGMAALTDLRCIATATTAADVAGLVAELRPDLLVIDIGELGAGGPALVRRVCRAAPAIAVVVFTARQDPESVSRAALAGAAAHVAKTVPLEELLDVLRVARPGTMRVAPSAASAGRPAVRRTEPPPSLTPRERQVIYCIGNGMPTQAIAHALGMSVNTCRGHLKSVYAKLGARSQLQAVLKARPLGLLDPPTDTDATPAPAHPRPEPAGTRR